MNETDRTELEKLTSLATSQALKGDWESAIKINKQILKSDPGDIDALNRLGHAYTESGMITEAMTTYRKVLRLDSYNGIASKNLKRLKTIKSKTRGNKRSKTTVGQVRFPMPVESLFLEVAGQTATVSLVELAEPKTLAVVNCADHVLLSPKKHQVTITTEDGIYLGKLPDNLAIRLIRLVGGGNRYEAYVKGVTDDQLRVFLKETKRAKRFASVNSFPIDDKSLYVAFTPPEMVHGEMPESRTLEEQGDGDEGEEEESGSSGTDD